MKKSRGISTLFFTCLGLSSCAININNQVLKELIFSEIVEGSSNNRALELYNISDNEIDLNGYNINIQLVSGIKEINLEGKLPSKSTYVIVYSESDSTLKEKADLVSENLMFIGSQPIRLMKGKKVIDSLGTWDYQIDYCRDLSLVRKEEYLLGREEFDEYDWIRYSLDNYKYLGTIKPSLTEEELLAGPKLTEEDLNRPYYIENENGYKYNSPVVVKGFKPVNASASIKKLHDDYVTHRITKADIVGVSVKRPNDKIKGVWFNKEKRTTVVKWFDDTVTKVTAAVNDEFNMECGLAMCYMKRWSFDNRGCFNEVFKKWIPKEEVKETVEVKE